LNKVILPATDAPLDPSALRSTMAQFKNTGSY